MQQKKKQHFVAKKNIATKNLRKTNTKLHAKKSKPHEKHIGKVKINGKKTKTKPLQKKKTCIKQDKIQLFVRKQKTTPLF